MLIFVCPDVDVRLVVLTLSLWKVTHNHEYTPPTTLTTPTPSCYHWELYRSFHLRCFVSFSSELHHVVFLLFLYAGWCLMADVIRFYTDFSITYTTLWLLTEPQSPHMWICLEPVTAAGSLRLPGAFAGSSARKVALLRKWRFIITEMKRGKPVKIHAHKSSLPDELWPEAAGAGVDLGKNAKLCQLLAANERKHKSAAAACTEVTAALQSAQWTFSVIYFLFLRCVSRGETPFPVNNNKLEATSVPLKTKQIN